MGGTDITMLLTLLSMPPPTASTTPVTSGVWCIPIECWLWPCGPPADTLPLPAAAAAAAAEPAIGLAATLVLPASIDEKGRMVNPEEDEEAWMLGGGPGWLWPEGEGPGWPW